MITFQKYHLVSMGVVAPVSAHMLKSAQSPQNTGRNISAQKEGGKKSNFYVSVFLIFPCALWHYYKYKYEQW